MPYAGPYYPPYPTIVPWRTSPYIYPTTIPIGPQIVPGGVYIGDPPPGMTTVTWSSSQTVHVN